MTDRENTDTTPKSQSPILNHFVSEEFGQWVLAQSERKLLIYRAVIFVATLVFGVVMWFAIAGTSTGDVVPVSIPLVGGVLTITTGAIYKLTPEPWASPTGVAFPYLVFGTVFAVWGVVML